MPQNLPGGNSFFGWLGRQVGHVKKAVKTNPAAAARPKPPPPKPAPAPEPQTEAPNEPTVIYRDGKVEEAPHPTEPGMKLRRTIIDEVIVERPEGTNPH
jgi:hypothetical protein